MAQQRCREDYMRKCRSIILLWNVSEHIRKQKRKQNKSKQTQQNNYPWPALSPPPPPASDQAPHSFGMTGSDPEMSLAKFPLPVSPSVCACLPWERNAQALFTVRLRACRDRQDRLVGRDGEQQGRALGEQCPRAGRVWCVQQTLEEGEREAGTADPTLELSQGLQSV